jgi:hypothetical protein
MLNEAIEEIKIKPQSQKVYVMETLEKSIEREGKLCFFREELEVQIKKLMDTENAEKNKEIESRILKLQNKIKLLENVVGIENPLREATFEDTPWSTIYLFGDYIYQYDIYKRTYEIISKENGWKYSKHSVFYMEHIFVISSYSGKIFKW